VFIAFCSSLDLWECCLRQVGQLPCVLDEIMKIDIKKIIVFLGEDEKKFEKEEFTKHNITVHHLKGGHRPTDVTPVFEKIREDIKAEAVR